MLYPLSYEGGDGAERGAKLGATARKPWEKGSSGLSGGRKWRALRDRLRREATDEIGELVGC